MNRNWLLLILIVVFYSCDKPVSNTDVITTGSVFFYGSDLNNKPVVSCLDLSSSQIVWTISATYAGSVLEWSDDSLYQNSYSRLYCYNATNGSNAWSQTLTAISAIPTPSPGAPYADDSLLYITGGESDYIYCWDKRTGQQKWRSYIGWNPHYGSPVVHDDYVYVSGSRGSSPALYCFNRFTGTQIWSVLPGGAVVSYLPVYSSGKIIVQNNSPATVFAFNALTGQLEWQYNFTGVTNPRGSLLIAAHGDKLFASTDPLYSSSPLIAAIDVNTGTKLWQTSMPADARFEPCFWQDEMILDNGIDVDEGFYVAINTNTGAIDNQKFYRSTFDTSLHLSVQMPVVVNDKIFTTATTGGPRSPADRVLIIDAKTLNILKEIDMSKLGYYVGSPLMVVDNNIPYYSTWAGKYYRQ